MGLNSKLYMRTTFVAAVKVICAAAIVLIGACGGGGGDSGGGANGGASGGSGGSGVGGDSSTVGTTPPPASDPVPVPQPVPAPTPAATDASMRISFDSGAVSMGYDQGNPSPTSATINAATQGTPSDKVVIGVTTPTGRPDPNISSVSVAISGTSARISVNPVTGLSPGTYTGTLFLQACTDAACTVHYAGSPWSVGYAITVAKAIQVSPASISLAGTSGVPSQKAVTVILPAGVPNYTVTSDSAWLSAEQITPTSFTLRTQGVPTGTLNGVLTLQGGGLTKTLPVQYVVTPQRLTASTASVNLAAQSGATAGTDVLVTLPEGASDYSIAETSLPAWLDIVSRTSSGFRLAAASMPSGRYTTRITLLSQAQVAPIDISYSVTAPSGGDRHLSVATKSVTLNAIEGSTSQAVALGLVRPSWNSNVTASVSYPAGTPSGWLTQASSSNGDLTVSASAANLPKGNYAASLVLTPAYPDPPLTVPVALTVGAGMAAPAPQTFTVTSDTTSSQLSGTIPVNFNGVTAANWRATTNSPWLNLTRASGGVGDSVAFTVQVAALPSSLASTTQTALVSLTATTDSGLAVTPTQTSVVLQFQLAEAFFAAPAPVIAGQAGNIIVRGRGFSRIANIESRLTVGGVTPTAVSTVDDTQLSVTLPALTAGRYTVGVSNALGVATGTTSLYAVAPTSLPYSALDTSALGPPRTLVYDAIHGDIYASYISYGGGGLSAVVRFRPTGSGWAYTTLSIPGLLDIALAPDASVLAATDSNNKVNLIDLSSFSVAGSYSSSEAFGNQGGYHAEVGIAFTNDGKLWLPTGAGYSWHQLSYFDLRSRSFGKASPPCSVCYDGPYFAVSRDGSRLMVTQSASLSPQPPMLYLDAVDDVLRTNPIGLTFFYDNTSLSDTGDRFLMGGGTVYDRSFGTIGAVPLSARSNLRSAQLSPDGRRVYLLNYGLSPSGSSSTQPVSISVVDSSPSAGQQATLSVLGSFNISDAPGCQSDLGYDITSCSRPKMRVTPDGNNLLLLGTRKLIVVPLPMALSGTPAAVRLQWAQTRVQR